MSKYRVVDFVTCNYIFRPDQFKPDWFPEVGETFKMRVQMLNLNTGKWWDIEEYGVVTITEVARAANLVGEGFARMGMYKSGDEGIEREIGLIFCGSMDIWKAKKERHKQLSLL